MNLEERIANAVIEKLTDGTVEKLVEQQIEKAVKDALEDVFRYSGKGRKMIEERLNEVIVPVIERHGFNQYIVKLDAVLTDIVNNTSLEDNKKILENFRGLMREPEKKEIKLSEIFEEYCKHVAANVNTDDLEAHCEDGEPYYDHVTAQMEVEHEDKGWFNSSFDDCVVKFTCDEDKDLNCQIKLYKYKTEEKWNLRHLGETFCDINSLRGLSEFEVFLMTLRRGFVDIIMDTESEYDSDIEPDEKPEWSLS